MPTATDDDAATAAASANTSGISSRNGSLTGKPKNAGYSATLASLPTTTRSPGLPDSVSHFYYKHGLFLSSYPTCASSIAIVAILLACYPLINIPLPGTIPTKIVLPYGVLNEFGNADDATNRSGGVHGGGYFDTGGSANVPFFGAATYSMAAATFGGGDSNDNVSYNLPHFPWAETSPPILYVQQITLRASVLPWTDEMQLMDAFRAPLYEVFKLLEIVRNHETDENQRTLEKICLHVENVKRSQHQEQIFPEYGCLVLSPANMWTHNVQNFTKDTNILNTIFQYHNLQKTKVSTAEMLFGLPMQDTGFKRYPLRARSRIIQYAITLILKQNDKEFLQTLKEKLLRYYPPFEIKETIKKKQQQTDEEQKAVIDDPEQQQKEDKPQKQEHQRQSTPKPKQKLEKSTITYIFYPGEYRIWEFLPISIAFVLVFTYVYFSVRKIDVFRSRMLLALTSVITVLGSLVMSLGLCFFFGLTISLQSKDIFPYLVILVGLENSLVITKSVVSMNETFDVKIRVAQALSKEGWHITKTLLTEITILTIGLATFVQVIQEFCVFAIVGLLSDFMLQMLLFSTILAMNIKRTEYTTEAKHLPKMMLSCTLSNTANHHHHHGHGGGGSGGYQQQHQRDFRFFSSSNGVIGSGGGGGGGFSPPPFVPGVFHRSQSHPKLSFADLNGVGGSGVSGGGGDKRASFALNTTVGGGGAGSGQSALQEQRIPKRIKIVNLWARTRFFQRAFMVWMSVWICSIVYNSGYLEQLFIVAGNHTTTHEFERKVDTGRGAMSSFFSNVHYALHSAAVAANGGHTLAQQREGTATDGGGLDGVAGGRDYEGNSEDAAAHINDTQAELRRLLYPDFELNYFLSNFHWSTIMKQYNISLSGHYVTILPTIKLSHVITPEIATLVRNPYEKVQQNFQWKALAAALDPLDFNDDDVHRESPMIMPGGTPLVPKSPMEIFFAITLCCISIFVLCYTMVVFYRCICTRNYAEWRSSWHESSEFPQKTEQILEGVPTQIAGHKHRIECLVSDGSYIISCCLKGQIKVWDARSGENTTTINRCDMQIAQQREDGQTMLRRLNTSPIWCLDYFDNLIAVGCANGRVELWETPAGVLKCTYHEDAKRNQGITHIHLNGDRVIVARLSGRLDFYRLETYYKGKQIDWGFTSAYRRTHVRTGSTGSLSLIMQNVRNQEQKNAKEEMKITLEGVRLAHQQPITCMEVVNDMVFTGSQDHTLKVYCLNKSDIEYTLHGHCGPITCLFVDRWQPGTGGSGSQDGLLCVWDLFTGACMYNIQAHDGAVSCLACAPSYVISLGTDERICVWERFQGNLLTTINISNAYSSLLMLTPSLLVTSKLGSLIVWDVRTGEPAREVKLDFANRQLCPKIMMLACDSVVCDYDNEIRVVRFPIVADKCH